MSLARKYLRPVALKRPLPFGQGEGFQSGYESVQATVQPLSGAQAAQMYGSRLGETRLLLAPGGTPVEIGMGVCLEVGPRDWPDWRVVYVAPWPRHTAAHIQYIPPWERVKRHED